MHEYTERRALGNGISTGCAPLIYDESGINLGPDKKTMLEIRLKRRLAQPRHLLATPSTATTCSHRHGDRGRARPPDRRRHHQQDRFLSRGRAILTSSRRKRLPDLTARNGACRQSLVWSAGCSTGEEPYTLAMVLSEYAQAHPGFRFRVLATDISHRRAGQGRSWASSSPKSVKPVPRGTAAESTSCAAAIPAVGPGAHGSGAARAGRVPAR